ncbi:MAG: hypothetical protein H0T46_34540 [Deltaproteobacteria bacterium]|nr:hypothetical protein [Deltaproteobacteria bacterium]
MDFVLPLVIAAAAFAIYRALPEPKPKAEAEPEPDGPVVMRIGPIEKPSVRDVDELRIVVYMLPDCVRWGVELPRPGTATFRIYPEGAKSFASKLFGGEDVELAVHPVFDYTFMIRADDHEAVRRMWRHEQCAALMGISREAVVYGEQQVIVLEAPGRFEDDVIERGIDLLVALARTDLYGIRVLSTLPDAKPVADSLVRLPGPGEIRVGPYRDGDRVRTRIWSQIRVDREVVVPFELGTAKLESEGVETTLTWDGIEEDPRRLLAGVAFVRSLAEAPALGVFR